MGTISRDAVQMQDKSATKERRILAYTGPASYATGGDTLNPESVALSKIEALVGLTISNGTNVLKLMLVLFSESTSRVRSDSIAAIRCG